MRIELERFRGRATIGASGQILVSGEGVLPLHAELKSRRDAGATRVALRALGEVWIIRGKIRCLIAKDSQWVLADGDSFTIGTHTCIYYNLDSAIDGGDLDAEVRRGSAWLTQ